MDKKREFSPSELPHKPGIYVFRDQFGKVIYVGKASDLRRRVSSYFQKSRRSQADAKLRSLINSINSWEFQIVNNEEEALILESRLIKDYAPYYNILMRDDKRYLLLKLDPKERFPTLKLARVKKDDGAKYFGPFPNGSALKMTLEFLLQHFHLRHCRTDSPDAEERKRCIPRHVKDCSAPCVGNIDEATYRANLDRTLAVLNGNIKELRDELKGKMLAESEAENFERAGRWRDVLTNLEAVFGDRTRNFSRAKLPGKLPGMDGVKSLQKALGLPVLPRKIVGFDISNIGGTLAVASLVALSDGVPDRDQYRRFRIRTVDHSDDFAMMDEAVGRFFARLLNEKKALPDLVMVDGGKGQLSSAIDSIIRSGAPPLPVIGLAKKNEEIFLPGHPDPIILDRSDPALKMLQLLRDEAHRFAIGYHRALRQRKLTESLLDEIPGVGAAKKNALLRKFGSIRELRKQSADTIAAQVPGIGQKLAENIVKYLAKS